MPCKSGLVAEEWHTDTALRSLPEKQEWVSLGNAEYLRTHCCACCSIRIICDVLLNTSYAPVPPALLGTSLDMYSQAVQYHHAMHG